MDALVYTAKKLSGSLIDAFEYYIAIFQHNKNFHLLFVGDKLGAMDWNGLYSIIKERYDLGDLDWEKNIKFLKKRNDLLFHKLNKALIIDWGTIPRIKGLLSANKTIVIPEFVTDEIYLSKRIYNAEYWGEMPFVYRDREYKMKFLFDRYKPLTKEEEGIFVSAPNHENVENDEYIKPYLTKNWFRKLVNHQDGFFEKFDTFIYYHSDRYLDPHPRLIHESWFFGKKVIYLNPYEVKDGSWYRYQDLIDNGLEDRYLNKNDEIVREFIDE